MVYAVLRLVYIFYFLTGGALLLMILMRALLNWELRPLKSVWVPVLWPLLLVVPKGRSFLKGVLSYAFK